MGTYNFQIKCNCPSCDVILLTVTGADANLWKKDAIIDGGHIVRCAICGCEFRTVNDEIPVSSGGGIKARDESLAQIYSRSVVSGTVKGGTPIKLIGHCLSRHQPIVTVGGNQANTVIVNDSELHITTPPGSIRLNVVGEPCSRLSIGNMNEGLFNVGDGITDLNTGSNAIVRLSHSRYLMVSDINGSLERGARIKSNSNQTTATLLEEAQKLQFQHGELVVGLTSKVTAKIVKINPLSVDTLSGYFTAGEMIWGKISGACAALDYVAPMNGFVDIEISNSWGQHKINGRLIRSFEYLP